MSVPEEGFCFTHVVSCILILLNVVWIEFRVAQWVRNFLSAYLFTWFLAALLYKLIRSEPARLPEFGTTDRIVSHRWENVKIYVSLCKMIRATRFVFLCVALTVDWICERACACIYTAWRWIHLTFIALRGASSVKRLLHPVCVPEGQFCSQLHYSILRFEGALKHQNFVHEEIKGIINSKTALS